MSQPLISIIIPTYNQAEYLREALHSVLKQSYPEWEAVIVDNHSTDHTQKVVAEFNEPRFRMFMVHNHGVIAISRNLGVKNAKGDWIAFLDSDDRWRSEKLSRCVKELLKPSGAPDLVLHDEAAFSDGRVLKILRYGPESRATFRSLLFEGSSLSPSAVVMRCELFNRVGGFSEDPEFATAEDYDLWMKVARTAPRMVFLREVLGDYRIHSASASASAKRHADAVLAVVKNNFEKLESPSLQDRIRYKRRLAFVTYTYGRAALGLNDVKLASRQFFRSMGEFPFFSRPYLGMALALKKWCSSRFSAN